MLKNLVFFSLQFYIFFLLQDDWALKFAYQVTFLGLSED